MLILLPLLGVLFNGLTTAHVEANLSLEFKATKLLRQHNPANCTVGNTTYAHGQTFKLDCKTQCVCENGRHACSSLCPKEQLPAPEDTMSCRSPRLVEVPGHCCKMWLCENPTADVYATCHNASTSPWTPCSRPCGLGISTRFTSTNTGCRQLSSIRLCENRKCDEDNNNKNYSTSQQSQLAQKVITVPQKYAHEQRQQQLISHNVANNLVVSEPEDTKDLKNYRALFEHKEHRIRKGHECRSLQRLGPARIRLGACISRKLYRPKLCGRCHQHSGKCCTPSVSTTIQVELLCPLKADDPINFAEQQQPEGQAPLQLWDTASLEPIDQEFLQSHQIQIENKFIAVEWILKCECGKYENCNNLQKYTATMHSSSGNKSNNGYNNQKQSKNDSNSNNSKRNNNSSWHTSGAVGDHNNNKNAATNIISDTTYNYNENAYNNNKNDVNMSSSGNNKGSQGSMANNHYNEQSIEVDNDSDNRYVQQQEQQADTAQQEQQQRLVSSGELQPDIIPYPAMLPPHRNTQQQNQTQMGQSNGDKRNSNNNKNKDSKYDNRSGIKGGIVDGAASDENMRVNAEHDNNNNNIKAIKNVAVPNKNENKIFASFAFYHHDGNDVDDKRDAGHSTSDDSTKQYVSDGQHQNALNEDGEQEQQLQLHKLQRLQDWEMDQNLHYQKQQPPTSESSLAASHQYYPQHQQKHHQHHHHHHQQHHQHHLQHHQLYPHTHPHSHTPQYPPQSQQYFLEQLRQQQEQPIEQQTFHQRRS
ncbi:transcription factor mef2A [Anastrepha ludens]|uniref:transcription factor mef2A n=1 Tax=Anastrepha ludens TaxID=28586 RepID=UPI0023B1B1FB|nr:transcription factor mef2A [Anastrepha ludens]